MSGPPESNDGGTADPEALPQTVRRRQRDLSRVDLSSVGERQDELERLPEVSSELYELGREFARGGLGRILRAKDRRLRRDVAVKELLSKHPKAEQRFIREAFITARLQHPNIVPIHEAGHWPDGRRFYAMKLVEGRTLAEALDSALSRKEREGLLRNIIAVADAVAYAHQNGILHRDLKPGNVMVGAFGETVVIDWGLAKDMWSDGPEGTNSEDGPWTGHEDTSDGMVVGTPPYMPPEQASAKPVDERADVYALGAMLYHVLAGRRPYQDVASKDVLLAVVSGPPKRLYELAPDCPRELIAIVEKAMARDPKDRYPSAQEMAAELRDYVDGRLVSSYNYSFNDYVRRALRRHRLAVGVGIVSMALLLCTGVLGYLRIRQEKEAVARKNKALTAEIEENKLSKARYLLDRDPTATLAQLKTLSAPRAGAPSLAFRAAQLGVARHVVTGRRRVDAVAVSPDGALAAAGDRSGRVRIVEIDSGEVRSFEAHDDRVTSLRFSEDGAKLVSSGYDETIRIRELGTDRVVVLRGHTGDATDVVEAPGGGFVSVGVDGVRRWSADGELVDHHALEQVNRNLQVEAAGGAIVTGGHGREVWLWSGLGEAPRRLLCDGREVSSLAVSNSGRSLACGGTDGWLRVFDLERQQLRLEERFDSEVSALSFLGSAQVVVGHFDGEVSVVDLKSGASRVLTTHDERVTVAAVGAGRIATAGWDGTIWVHPGEGAREGHRLRGHADVVTSLAFDPAGRWLVSGSWDGSLRVWPMKPERGRVLAGHSVGVHAVDVSPGGRLIASGGHDDQVRLWRRTTGDLVRTFRGHEDHVYRVLFSPDGRWVASSSDDRTVRLWPVDGDGARVLRGHEADVEELAFSPDGRWLASAGEDNRVWLWNLDRLEGRPLVGHSDFVSDVVFAPGGRRLYSTGRDGRLLEWAVDGGGARELLDIDQALWALAIRGEDLLAVGGDALHVIPMGDGERVTLSNLPGVRRVAVSSDLNMVALASVRADVWICDAGGRSRSNCHQPTERHDGEIHDIVFSPNGDLLATAGSDREIRLWDTRSLEYAVLLGHSLPVFDLAFSPDGQVLVSGSADADVRVWPRVTPPRRGRLFAWLEERTSFEADGAP